MKKRGGFTLTELLVACVLLMFLVLLLFSVFSYVAGTYQQTESRADSFRDGRAALLLMGKELDSLIDPLDCQTNTNAPLIPRLIVKHSGTNLAFGFLSRVFQVAQPTSNAPSDVCGVGYFVAVATNSTVSKRALFRTLIPSDETYSRLKSGGAGLFQETDWSSDAPYAEPIADNVIGFSVKVLDADFQEIANPTGMTNEAYVEIALKVIGSRNGETYFKPDAALALKQKIEKADARSFVLRARLKSTLN